MSNFFSNQFGSCRPKLTSATTFFTSAVICATIMPTLALASGNLYNAAIDCPPRLQWEGNFGYCGEVSIITANLRYGQYLSQYTARDIASNGTDQSKESSQLLLGVNDVWAASQMHLKAAQWDNSAGPDADAFLTWVKDGILANSSIIMAIYTNEYLFYGKKSPTAGDRVYDHIVPVTAVSSESPLAASSTYYPNDTVTFSDNGLYTPHGKPIYTYTYTDSSFQRSRQKANDKASPPYSLPSTVRNYGLAISGIVDHDGQTLPVQLTTNLNFEKPAIKDGSNTRPAPESLILSITISSLKPGQKYNLYRYNNFSNVPDASFNAKHSQAAKSWQIHSATQPSYTLNETIQSDEIAVYRAVPVTAP